MSPTRTMSPTETFAGSRRGFGHGAGKLSGESAGRGADTLRGEFTGREDVWTLQALRSVWTHQRGRVEQRIGVIERAAAALAEGRLDAGLRIDAERAAHMLAGSLGMFGFLDASEAARELEAELLHPSTERAAQLPVLLCRLRAGIEGPVSLCTADEQHRQPLL